MYNLIYEVKNYIIAFYVPKYIEKVEKSLHFHNIIAVFQNQLVRVRTSQILRVGFPGSLDPD